VIRVDGDGQHDASDIPRVYEKLKTTGCESALTVVMPLDQRR
jgi:hypothetical protein